MSINHSWQKLLLKYKAIAVIRSPQTEIGLAMAQAVAKGGIRLIEITWNSQQPQKLITQLRGELPNCYIGAGTILNLQQLKEAVACGAQFLFCPHFNSAILKAAIEDFNLPLIPGTLSPTEIVTAWQAGASAVKVFPIEVVGGASYIKNLQGPLGQIPLIPTGGVTLDNAKEMIAAGAIAVGISSQIFLPDLVAAKNWQAITQRSQRLIASLNQSV